MEEVHVLYPPNPGPPPAMMLYALHASYSCGNHLWMDDGRRKRDSRTDELQLDPETLPTSTTLNVRDTPPRDATRGHLSPLRPIQQKGSS